MCAQPHFTPIAAPTRSSRREVAAEAYDCVRFLLIRNGSMILHSDRVHQPVRVGGVVRWSHQSVCGYEPEGDATVTMLGVDLDYLVEHLFWQHLDPIPDRDAARDLAARLYPDPV